MFVSDYTVVLWGVFVIVCMCLCFVLGYLVGASTMFSKIITDLDELERQQKIDMLSGKKGA